VKAKFQHSSLMATTDLEKVVLNSGIGKAVTKDRKWLESTQQALREIALGQKPVLTKARKSIVGFGLRQGIPIGCKVTLRRKKA
jgi:large subunit ribosomal protein L5